MNTVIQIHITLDKTEPIIWRRLLVPDSVTFFDLHHIIQIGMGWKNSHLFEFIFGNYRIGFEDKEMDGSEDVADANQVTLDTLLIKEGLQFRYTYDFGDSWYHTIKVEKLTTISDQQLPFCLEGEQNCPPEDCGGIPGFYNLLGILKDKTHPAFQDTYTWVGRYNPKKFDIKKVNSELPNFKKYMKHWKK